MDYIGVVGTVGGWVSGMHALQCSADFFSGMIFAHSFFSPLFIVCVYLAGI